ncbi:MAG: hypothetical protein ACMUEL_02580 [Flavobacteriales bacterium Tduv]
MILDISITVRPLFTKGAPPSYVGENRKKEGKSKLVKEKKGKKRDLIRSRNSRKMAQEIR